MNKTKILYILIAMLVTIQIYSIFQMSSLKANLKNTENLIASTEERLERNISEIYSNVAIKLEEKASLLTSSGYEIGKFNPQTLKVPVTFKLQTKTLTEKTMVFLEFGDEKTPMARQGMDFVLTKDFAIKDEISPTIIIEDKGVLQVEKNEFLVVNNIKNQVFSLLSPQFEGESGYSAYAPYNFHLKGRIEMSSQINADNIFKDIKYIVTLDDKVIKTYQADFVGSGNVQIDDVFKMEKGQKLIGKVIATDELNFTHEYMIMNFVAGEGEQLEVPYETEQIIAPGGEIIYEFDELEEK